MATPIKSVPILSGEIADEFVRLAEEKERKSKREISPESSSIVREMERQLREFVSTWKKQ
jgi:hypothetical protein